MHGAGYWNNSLTDEMDIEILRPTGDFVHESTSAWDQHVMDIDYDVSQALFLVLDTNFLLKHLSLLKSLAAKLLEAVHLMPPLFLVLPGVVVDELDYQSKHGVRERATAATLWLQEQIELRVRTGKGVLRAQKEDETLRGGKSSTASSRWAPPQSYHAPRVVVAQSSLYLAAHDVIHDDDIDMEDMSMSPTSYSHDNSSKDVPIYRRLAEEPLENFIKNLQYDDVLSRVAGAIPYPETPRQTLVRISKSIPPQILHLVSERGEPGYRAGGIKMWSRGDIANATTALERLFSELGRWDDDRDRDQDLGAIEDKARAKRALVSIVRAFREEEERRWRGSW
ncbi:hypothetical protein FRC06_008914 [Ceratobasidium sp. 370]|nr:hypothetical protein FRC06_008914 [Ceratobasidium sp. 370]